MARQSHDLPPDIDRKRALSCFKNHREDLLIIQRCLPTLTNSLLAKSLITKDVYDEACNERQSKTARAKAILDCLEDTLVTKSSNFTKVIDMFKSDSILEFLADKLILSYKSSDPCHFESEEKVNVDRQDSGFSGSLTRSLSVQSSTALLNESQMSISSWRTGLSPAPKDQTDDNIQLHETKEEVKSTLSSGDEGDDEEENHEAYKFHDVRDRLLKNRTPQSYKKYYKYEKEEYIEDMTENEKVIRQKFISLVNTTFDSLEKRINSIKKTLTIEQLQRFILTYFTSMDDFKVDEINSEFEGANNLNAIQRKLATHYSFCNFDVLESLIHEYGTKKDKKNLENYQNKFKEFCFVVYNNRVCGPHIHGKCSVTFKLNFEPDCLKGKDLQNIKSRISGILGLRSSASLYLHRIREGCLQLDFLVSDTICRRICHSNEEMNKEFFKDKITFIEVYNPISSKVLYLPPNLSGFLSKRRRGTLQLEEHLEELVSTKTTSLHTSSWLEMSSMFHSTPGSDTKVVEQLEEQVTAKISSLHIASSEEANVIQDQKGLINVVSATSRPLIKLFNSIMEVSDEFDTYDGDSDDDQYDSILPSYDVIRNGHTFHFKKIKLGVRVMKSVEGSTVLIDPEFKRQFKNLGACDVAVQMIEGVKHELATASHLMEQDLQHKNCTTSYFPEDLSEIHRIVSLVQDVQQLLKKSDVTISLTTMLKAGCSCIFRSGNLQIAPKKKISTAAMQPSRKRKRESTPPEASFGFKKCKKMQELKPTEASIECSTTDEKYKVKANNATPMRPRLDPKRKNFIKTKLKPKHPYIALKEAEGTTLILHSKKRKRKFKPAIVSFDSSSSDSDSDSSVDYEYDISDNIYAYLHRHSSFV